MPWRLVDVLIGLAVPAVAFAALAFMSLAIFPSPPQWLWIPLAFLNMTWMLAYPLRIARSRGGLPRLPRPRVAIVEAIFASAGVLALMAILTGLSSALVRIFGSPAMPGAPFEPIAGSANRLEPLALILLTVAVAPIAEEVFFRGMIYNALRRRIHPIPAALLQAIAFALFHPFGLADRAAIAVVGFCLALFYEWRKTLLAPVLLHTMMNAATMTAMFWGMTSYEDAPILGVRVTPHKDGCLITEVVPGGAAAGSGLRIGDVLVTVDGVFVADLSGLRLVLRSRRVGDMIPVVYIRGEQAYQVDASLQGRPK